MDYSQQPLALSSPSSSSLSLSWQTILIFCLVILLILSSFGINLFEVLAKIYNWILTWIGPLIIKPLQLLLYSLGWTLDASSQTVTDVGKTGLDLANNAIHGVGNLLEESSKGTFDNVLNTNALHMNEAKPSDTNTSIQQPISVGKSNWCLVGEYNGTRNCMEVGNDDTCTSGQLFPQKSLCLNPAMQQGTTQGTMQQGTMQQGTTQNNVLPYNVIMSQSIPPLSSNPLVIPHPTIQQQLQQ